MNASTYRAAITKLGLSQRGAALFFGFNPSTGQRWATDGPPPFIDIQLRLMLMIQSNMHIQDVPAWINLMIGRKMEIRKPPKKRISP